MIQETFKKIKESYDFLRKIKNKCDGNNGGSNDDGPDDSKHSDIYETYETMLVHFVEYIMKTQKGFENFDPITIKTTLKVDYTRM